MCICLTHSLFLISYFSSIKKQAPSNHLISYSLFKPESKRLPKQLRIDMTPLVDLGFLLITFFIFTTTLGEKKGLNLVMPQPEGPSSFLNERYALSILLGKGNEVYVYEGSPDEAMRSQQFRRTNYNVYEGIGKLIREKQDRLFSIGNADEKNDLVLLIKPLKESTYKNLVDALDEAAINQVKKYMVVEPSDEEQRFFEIKNQ